MKSISLILLFMTIILQIACDNNVINTNTLVEKDNLLIQNIENDNENNGDKSVENMSNLNKNDVETNSNIILNSFETVNDDLSLCFIVQNTTSTNLTLLCSHKVNENEPFDYTTGSYYCLEKQVNGEWISLEYIVNGGISWTEEAWIIPNNEFVTWNVNWEWLYGKLEVGQYRIGKEILVFDDNSNYKKEIVYANFVIE